MAMAGTFVKQMYNGNKLLSSLVQLGVWLREEAPSDGNVKRLALAQNGWFTPDSIDLALSAHGQALTESGVTSWASSYTFPGEASTAKVGLILAGNLPLVGWHDIMCAVLSGRQVHVKLSKDDAVLPKWLVAKWAELDSYVADAVTFHDGLMQGMDAVIATGAGNTMRYFEAYFGHLPHVFRGPRTSVAVLNGQETDEELRLLGDDIFAHFGMGCRSVTKVWLPEGFDLDRCFAQWLPWGHLAQHGKYANNYDYHKAVWLLNKEDMVENGFVLVKADEGLTSPIGTLFVERFTDLKDVANKLADQADGIQVVTVRESSAESAAIRSKGLRTADFGCNQCPTLSDYADGVDTLAFLLKLSPQTADA